MSMARKPAGTLALVALLAILAAPAAAQEADAASNPALHYFTDVTLVNQYGEPMRLYSDLLQGKVVLINTVFTACTGMCPMLSSTVEKVQAHVGDRVGQDVHLISISVDPENDTPEKMAELAERFHAQRGWYFLTGDPENVAMALRKLGQFTEDPESHQGVMIMGNETTGLWKKAFGLAGAEELIRIFDTVLHDAGAPPEQVPLPGADGSDGPGAGR
jgi:protein SCO1/2